MVLENHLGVDISNASNPLDAVAIGATALENVCFSDELQGDHIQYLEVNFLSLGFETAGGVMIKVILRHTPIPTPKMRLVSSPNN